MHLTQLHEKSIIPQQAIKAASRKIKQRGKGKGGREVGLVSGNGEDKFFYGQKDQVGIELPAQPEGNFYILAHTHPSGNVFPSVADIQALLDYYEHYGNSNEYNIPDIAALISDPNTGQEADIRLTKRPRWTNRASQLYAKMLKSGDMESARHILERAGFSITISA